MFRNRVESRSNNRKMNWEKTDKNLEWHIFLIRYMVYPAKCTFIKVNRVSAKANPLDSVLPRVRLPHDILMENWQFAPAPSKTIVIRRMDLAVSDAQHFPSSLSVILWYLLLSCNTTLTNISYFIRVLNKNRQSRRELRCPELKSITNKHCYCFEIFGL